MLAYQGALKIKREGEQTFLMDPVRKKAIVLTPEELVRQLTIIYLHEELGYPIGRFSVEKKITLHGMTKRYDIVVFDKQGRPFILVECKRSKIALDEAVCHQIARYNLVLKVPFLMITNGPHSFFYELNYNKEEVSQIDVLPKL